jgi:uroporphyrinogen-III synthase
LQIEPAADLDQIAEALHEPAEWLVLTSRNGVQSFLQAVRHAGLAPHELAQAIATVGPATAELLREAGFAVELTPLRATAAALVECLAHQSPGRCLLLQGNLAEKTIETGLARAGFTVRGLTVYRTVERASDPEALRLALAESAVAAVTLLSPSAARVVAREAGTELFRAQRLVCIGPVTAGQVRELGAEPARIAEPHTVAGVVQAVVGLLRDGTSTRSTG